MDCRRSSSNFIQRFIEINYQPLNKNSDAIEGFQFFTNWVMETLGKPHMYLRTLHWCFFLTGSSHVRHDIEEDYTGGGGGRRDDRGRQDGPLLL